MHSSATQWGGALMIITPWDALCICHTGWWLCLLNRSHESEPRALPPWHRSPPVDTERWHVRRHNDCLNNTYIQRGWGEKLADSSEGATGLHGGDWGQKKCWPGASPAQFYGRTATVCQKAQSKLNGRLCSSGIKISSFHAVLVTTQATALGALFPARQPR